MTDSLSTSALSWSTFSMTWELGITFPDNWLGSDASILSFPTFDSYIVKDDQVQIRIAE